MYNGDMTTNALPTRTATIALGYIVRYADGASEFHHSARGSRAFDLPTEVAVVTAATTVNTTVFN